MMKSWEIVAIYISLLSVTYSEAEVVHSFEKSCPQFFFRRLPPRFNGLTEGDNLICQKYNGLHRFATSYNRADKIPYYSAYTIDSFSKTFGRKDIKEDWYIETQLSPFHQDKNRNPVSDMTLNRKLKKTNKEEYHRHYQAVDGDYKGSSYDRGHLNPAGHHNEDRSSKEATFTLTNTAPQPHVFNNDIWGAAEDMVWTYMQESCNFPGARRYIITGVVPSTTNVLRTTDGNIGVNIPDYFWSAVCCDSSNATREDDSMIGWSLAFLGQNTATCKHNDIYTVQDLASFLQANEIFHKNDCLFDAKKAKDIVTRIMSSEKHKTKFQIKSNNLKD